MVKEFDARQPDSHSKRPFGKKFDSSIDADSIAREQRFWMGLLYAALAGYAAFTLTLAMYLFLTWSQQPYPGWFSLVAALTALCSAKCYYLRRVIVESPRRLMLFCVGNVMSFVITVLACVLDGGVSSPLAFLIILPMLYLAIGYPPKAVLICGAVGLLACVALFTFDPASVRRLTGLVLFMAMAIGFLIAIVGALSRDRKNREWFELRQRLITVAATDELTGCLNQRAFNSEIRQETVRAMRYQHSLALLMIDLDDFKRVNDEFGHPMGDQMLGEAAAALRQTARQADIVGRTGGDELALLAPETGSDGAHVLAERLRSQLRSYALPIDMTLSIGIYATIPESADIKVLLRRADQALYAAKRDGRDRVVTWYQALSETHKPPLQAVSHCE